MNQFIKLLGCKINVEKLIIFLHTNNEQLIIIIMQHRSNRKYIDLTDKTFEKTLC
jgi:hypothetical protein